MEKNEENDLTVPAKMSIFFLGGGSFKVLIKRGKRWIKVEVEVELVTNNHSAAQ